MDIFFLLLLYVNVNDWMPPHLPSFFGSLVYFPFHQSDVLQIQLLCHFPPSYCLKYCH